MISRPRDMPPPGSPAAVKSGCICPKWDNHFGKGYGGNGEEFGWVTFEKCPLHSPDHTEVPDAKAKKG